VADERSPIGDILSDYSVAQIGSTVPAATAGAILARLGARVTRFAGTAQPQRAGTSSARVVAIMEVETEAFQGGGSWHDHGSSFVRDVDVVIADVSSSEFLEDDEALARYRDLVRQHNTLSWVTISPWGINGPHRLLHADELPILAAGGLTHYMRNSAGRPMKPAGFAASVTAGQYAALAALHGLLLSNSRVEPIHLDLSMQDAIVVAGVFMECTHLLFNCPW
jgi:crotonobetainyl-CoA:carnitine CoA-transferase CaiB-like acyl-CoA transferase